MSDRSKIAAATKNIVFVPLNKLKKSPKNVRQARRVFRSESGRQRAAISCYSW